MPQIPWWKQEAQRATYLTFEWNTCWKCENLVMHYERIDEAQMEYWKIRSAQKTQTC